MPPPPAPGGVGQVPQPMPYAAYPPQPAPRRGGSRGLKIALIITGVIVVLLGACAVTGVFIFWKYISAPADVANDYVKAVNEGNLDEAYEMLSRQAKANLSLSEFKSNNEPLQGKIEKWNTSQINVESTGDGSIARVQMDVSLTDGSKITWDMFLIKQDGVWKMDTLEPR